MYELSIYLRTIYLSVLNFVAKSFLLTFYVSGYCSCRPICKAQNWLPVALDAFKVLRFKGHVKVALTLVSCTVYTPYMSHSSITIVVHILACRLHSLSYLELIICFQEEMVPKDVSVMYKYNNELNPPCSTSICS
jgi:hypothetical protein